MIIESLHYHSYTEFNGEFFLVCNRMGRESAILDSLPDIPSFSSVKRAVQW